MIAALRPSTPLAFLLSALLLLLSSSAHADGGNAEEAKRHFTNGVHLFEDRNFAGAMVEFEASFQQNPTAVALQNVAVCQKGLFRYAEAIGTLERMLREFGAQLSPEDRKAAEDAIREMSALIGTVVLKINPADARVTINDAPLATDALKGPIKLAAGEYHVVAEAPGHARQEKVVTVLSGQKERPITITLSPLSGTLYVRTYDSQAAIAIDGVQVGYEEWRGPVSAGPHEVYVYTSTLRRRSSVNTYAGQTTEFEARLTAADAIPVDRAAGPTPPPYVAPAQRGFFGYVVFGPETMGSGSPPGIDQSKKRSTGAFGALSGGYRFSTLFAVEFSAETANHDIAACATDAVGGCGAATGAYHIVSSRIGPGVRFMTNGRKGRFVATLGFGTAVHQISYDDKLKSSARSDASAVGTYVRIGGSYELNLGHFLLDAGVIMTAEGIDKDKLGIESAGSFGLQFRAGYGQW